MKIRSMPRRAIRFLFSNMFCLRQARKGRLQYNPLNTNRYDQSNRLFSGSNRGKIERVGLTLRQLGCQVILMDKSDKPIIKKLK